MAWEQRRCRRYYYAANKRGGVVHKSYYGADEIGRQAAELDDRERLEREASRARKVVYDAAEGQLKEFHRLARLLMEAEMLAGGFRQHKRGDWKKRHAGT